MRNLFKILFSIGLVISLTTFVSCKKFRHGCMIPTASNYDSTAIFDDSSCIYYNDVGFEKIYVPKIQQANSAVFFIYLRSTYTYEYSRYPDVFLFQASQTYLAWFNDNLGNKVSAGDVSSNTWYDFPSAPSQDKPFTKEEDNLYRLEVDFSEVDYDAYDTLHYHCPGDVWPALTYRTADKSYATVTMDVQSSSILDGMKINYTSNADSIAFYFKGQNGDILEKVVPGGNGNIALETSELVDFGLGPLNIQCNTLKYHHETINGKEVYFIVEHPSYKTINLRF